MMKVRKSSWHYRLWRLGRNTPDSRPPKNLCQYFWHIVLIKLLIPLVGISGFLVGVGALLYVIWGHPVDAAGIVVGVILGTGLVYGLVTLAENLYHRHQTRVIDKKMSLTPPKEPGLLRSMLRARKQQMCPLIQVIDE